MKVSIVVPVYQNEGSIAETHDQIQATFERDLPQHEYELVLVDDGSKDGSWGEILALQARDPRVKAITFTRNFGQMAAMLAGFKVASGDAVINISADLQDPVELIPQMVGKWEAGSELVICFRASRSDPLFARFTSRVAYSVLRMSLPQMVTQLAQEFRGNPNLVVYIRADKDSRYDLVAQVIDGCQKSGITRYSLRTEPTPDR